MNGRKGCILDESGCSGPEKLMSPEGGLPTCTVLDLGADRVQSQPLRLREVSTLLQGCTVPVDRSPNPNPVYFHLLSMESQNRETGRDGLKTVCWSLFN